MYPTFSLSSGHITAQDRYEKAAAIYFERTGVFFSEACRQAGGGDASEGREIIAADHPDIAPGFDGLPFSVEVLS